MALQAKPSQMTQQKKKKRGYTVCTKDSAKESRARYTRVNHKKPQRGKKQAGSQAGYLVHKVDPLDV
jgi:hypothetical protein